MPRRAFLSAFLAWLGLGLLSLREYLRRTPPADNQMRLTATRLGSFRRSFHTLRKFATFLQAVKPAVLPTPSGSRPHLANPTDVRSRRTVRRNGMTRFGDVRSVQTHSGNDPPWLQKLNSEESSTDTDGILHMLDKMEGQSGFDDHIEYDADFLNRGERRDTSSSDSRPRGRIKGAVSGSSLRGSNYTLVFDKEACAGCGTKLNSDSLSTPGYVPAHVLERTQDEPVFCHRCFRLRHHGTVDDDMRPGWSREEVLSPAYFEKLVGAIRGKTCVIITLIDVFDFHGSILQNLGELAGNNPVIVAVNKMDLLPQGFNELHAKQWIRQEIADMDGWRTIRQLHIHLVSVRSNIGIANLMDQAKKIAIERHCDIYVVGAANVGKSSLLNRILYADGGRFDNTKTKGALLNDKDKRPGITASLYPGTTLEFLKVDVGDGVNLFDTPGLILPHQLTLYLTPEELKQVLPRKRVKHVTFRVGGGKTVLLGGLGRIEILEGLPYYITFFIADSVTIHPMTSKEEDVDSFVRFHIGDLLSPPSDIQRLNDIGKLETHDITIDGAGWNRAACDVVLSGLGWVSFTGCGYLRIRVSMPEGIMVMQRYPLLPEEARATSVSVKNGRVRRPTRKATRSSRAYRVR